MAKRAHIIGGGFAGLASAIAMADKGYDVTILEKNATIGGRARKFEDKGFIFDMGPSWYWMPDVFETFFNRYGKKVSDYYDLVRLNPSYRVYFKEESVDIPASMEELLALFEAKEKGSSNKLKSFLKDAQYKYEFGINKLVYYPSKSVLEFIKPDIISGTIKYSIFSSFEKLVHKHFKHPHLREILKFPVLFLGAKPKDTPALYSLMNYADLQLGTWYPMGGMHKIVEAMEALAKENGVKIFTNEAVEGFTIVNNKITNIKTAKNTHACEVVIGSADYHHIDQHLLPSEHRQYSEKYWDSRVMAPSSLIYYLGINRKLKNLKHHNLFFDESFDAHAKEIYDQPQWPKKPLFYVCAPSVTDNSVAPEGKENLFILIPVAPGISESDDVRESYLKMVLQRIKEQTGETITADDIIVKHTYAHKEFISDYNSFKGNAYGLANTLTQTAFLKPQLHHKKIKNLLFSGQLTVPGPGVPPALISGMVAASEADKLLKN
jgi:phytoene desaturase